ncbi:LysR family transcriptional regulator [Parasedimentitalea marina]|uniref:LysR family transcriptional regulator n=2 Tax=Parasedimentitalea marina TaxID=2483033 RepID=A0A3T0N7B7_9RHOB|nr:LysR family transcriptional regulator [Parasedimentitalea marina]
MFDAAARHLNFRLAADELNLSQGAVAQQVRRLEADLGHKLFFRQARGLSLTDAGRRYHQPVRQALELIEQATSTLAPSEHRITLSVPPSFAAKWLVPRLPDFEATHPDIELRILAEENLSDFKRDGIDLAIRLGTRPRDPELQTKLLSPMDLVAVARPDVALTLGQKPKIEMLALSVLIQDGHHYWDRLLRDAGLTATRRVLQFNQTALAMDAAVNGQGLALVPRIFLDGQPLQQIWQAPVIGDAGFYVVWSAENRQSPSRQLVVDWLLSQVIAYD